MSNDKIEIDKNELAMVIANGVLTGMLFFTVWLLGIASLSALIYWVVK